MEIWESVELRAKLTETCAVCDDTCGNLDLREHLLRHETLLTEVLDLLPLAQSPFMDCCLSCLQAPDLPPFCPVALNLCAYCNVSMPGEDFMGELNESWGNLLQQGNLNKRRRPTEQEPVDRPQQSVSRALIQLALRHESQLQAMAMEDQFILFLQSDQRGILPILIQATKQWQELQKQKKTQWALRNHLFQTVTQELLARLEKVMQTKAQDEAWQGLLTAKMINQTGAWRYMTWCPQKKALIPLDRPPITMEKMQQYSVLRSCGSRP